MIERTIYEQIKPVLHTKEAVVITGMRRVGKTTLMRFIETTIASKNTLFLDLENPINRRYFESENYDRIAEELKFLGLDLGTQGYVFLDEVQLVTALPSVVKYLSDHYPIKFFLSGSSSFYLKNRFTESLSGRKYVFELFPLSFGEFVQFKKASLVLPHENDRVSAAQFETIDRYYEEYLRYGGFPGVVLKESAEEKRMMLEDIFTSYFQLEIVQLGEFRKTGIIRDLLLLLLARTGAKLDIQKLSRELGVSRPTIVRYIDFLEDTYFISRIRPMSRNRDAEIRSTPKFYVCDTGMIAHFARVDEGALFENAIFSALRTSGEVRYYQRKNGAEIDFIVNDTHAYEVKLSADKRDVDRLHVLSQELKIPDYRIIARKYRDLEKVCYGWMI